MTDLKRVELPISTAIDLIPFACPSPYDFFKQWYDGGMCWVAYIDEDRYVHNIKLEKSTCQTQKIA